MACFNLLNRVKSLTILFVFALFFIKSAAQENWVLKKDKDGIQVYEAKNSETNFKSVKAECTMTATLSQVAAVLSDVARHYQWVYGVKTAKIVKRESESKLFYYSEVHAPWPVSNRDFIVDFEMTQPASGMLSVASHAVPEMLPEQQGLVRVKKSRSIWTVTSIGAGQVKVVYFIEFDPAGSVPAWVVNMFIADGPHKTFENLRERVKLPEYRDVHYGFLKD